MKKPELLAPAGNIQKARIAFQYGADAVYLGGTFFGLRKYAENFTIEEIQHIIAFSNSLNKRVYLVFNSFAHESELSFITGFTDTLRKLQPHALIVSDIGVIGLLKKYTDIPIHVSTQASICNAFTARLYQNQGVSRLILARELTLEEIIHIQEQTNLECEVFIHGAMCASYSGKCTISNYSSGRDSNRGGCVQSCRHLYRVVDPESGQEALSSHLMNARDIMAVRMLPQLMKANISSVKIEGRMKSNMYVANAVSVYRKAIDSMYETLLTNPDADLELDFEYFEEELKKVSNRTFSMGNFQKRMEEESLYFDFNGYCKETEYVGTAMAVFPGSAVFIEVKSPLTGADTLEILMPRCKNKSLRINTIYNMDGEIIEKAQPNMTIRLDWIPGITTGAILRKKINHENK